jgi:hypothetical protein
MNLPYEEVRIRYLARNAIKRRFPNGNLNLMLKGVTTLDNAVVAEVNSTVNANVLRDEFTPLAYETEIIAEEEGAVQVRIAR